MLWQISGDNQIIMDILSRNFRKYPSRYSYFFKDFNYLDVDETIDVSIVIPIYNKIEYTKNCLDSVVKYIQPVVNCEIIVVDNASSDYSYEYISTHYNHVNVHRNQVNLGFAKACNQGFLLSHSKNVLFLNNDTYCFDDLWLTNMLASLHTNSNVGVVGNKQLFPHSNLIHHAGITFSHENNPLHIDPHKPKDYEPSTKSRYVPAVTGACMLVDKDSFCNVGLFDESYVNGYEDVDLCLKMLLIGKQTWYCSSSIIYHFGFISEGRLDHDDKNLILFKEKWCTRVSDLIKKHKLV